MGISGTFMFSKLSFQFSIWSSDLKKNKGKYKLSIFWLNLKVTKFQKLVSFWFESSAYEFTSLSVPETMFSSISPTTLDPSVDAESSLSFIQLHLSKKSCSCKKELSIFYFKNLNSWTTAYSCIYTKSSKVTDQKVISNLTLVRALQKSLLIKTMEKYKLKYVLFLKFWILTGFLRSSGSSSLEESSLKSSSLSFSASNWFRYANTSWSVRKPSFGFILHVFTLFSLQNYE